MHMCAVLKVYKGHLFPVNSVRLTGLTCVLDGEVRLALLCGGQLVHA